MNHIPWTPQEDEAFAELEARDVNTGMDRSRMGRPADTDGSVLRTGGAEAAPSGEGEAAASDRPAAGPEETPALRPSPVTWSLAEELANEWSRIRDAQIKAWIDRNCPQDRETVYEEFVKAFYALLDQGEAIRMSFEEVHALTEHFQSEFDTIMQAEDSPLKRAIEKLTFAWGRGVGGTNYDMGIEEPKDGTCPTC